MKGTLYPTATGRDIAEEGRSYRFSIDRPGQEIRHVSFTAKMHIHGARGTLVSIAEIQKHFPQFGVTGVIECGRYGGEVGPSHWIWVMSTTTSPEAFERFLFTFVQNRVGATLIAEKFDAVV